MQNIKHKNQVLELMSYCRDVMKIVQLDYIKYPYKQSEFDPSHLSLLIDFTIDACKLLQDDLAELSNNLRQLVEMNNDIASCFNSYKFDLRGMHNPSLSNKQKSSYKLIQITKFKEHKFSDKCKQIAELVKPICSASAALYNDKEYGNKIIDFNGNFNIELDNRIDENTITVDYDLFEKIEFTDLDNWSDIEGKNGIKIALHNYPSEDDIKIVLESNIKMSSALFDRLKNSVGVDYKQYTHPECLLIQFTDGLQPLENELNIQLLQASKEDQDLNVSSFLTCTRLNQEKAPKFVGDPEQKEECKENEADKGVLVQTSASFQIMHDTKEEDTMIVRDGGHALQFRNTTSGNENKETNISENQEKHQPMLTGQRPISIDPTAIPLEPRITRSEEQLKIMESLVRDIQNNKNKEEDNQIVSERKNTNIIKLSKKITLEELNKMQDSLGVKDDEQKKWQAWLKHESKSANRGMF